MSPTPKIFVSPADPNLRVTFNRDKMEEENLVSDFHVWQIPQVNYDEESAQELLDLLEKERNKDNNPL